MLDVRIPTSGASLLDHDDPMVSIHTMLEALDRFATAGGENIAPQQDTSALAAPLLAARYAAASPIIRRRFDAILREAETVTQAGMTMIAKRAGRHDMATIKAARFLGNYIAGSMGKLEKLVMLQPA